MDEKDRIITAIYNDTRARARSVPALPCPLFTGLGPPSRIPVPTALVLSPSGPTEPGSCRSNSRGSSRSHHPGRPQAQEPCPPEPPTWTEPAVCSLSGLPTQNACNKVVLSVPSGPLLKAQHPQPRRSAGPRPPRARPPGRCVPFPCCSGRGVWRGRACGRPHPSAPAPPLPAAGWGARVWVT